MDELDDLLKDLQGGGAPAPAAPAAAAAPAAVPAASRPTSTMADLSELDALMADLHTTPKPQAATITTIAAPAPVPTPAAAPAGRSNVDDLLADLQSFTPAKPAAAAVPTTSDADRASIDGLLSDLQSGVAAPAPAATAAVSTGADALSDLDKVMADFTTAAKGAGTAGTGASIDSVVKAAGGGAAAAAADAGPAPPGSKGVCSMCRQHIVGEVATVIGKLWHPACFCCLQCRKPLSSHTFFEKEGFAYCDKCFHESFSHRCAYCNGPILDRCINALGKMWHPDHFFCSQCGNSFDGCGFMEKEGKGYCESCYYSMFAPKCGSCDKPIMSDCVSALGYQWHPNCFVCHECHKGFDGGAFYDHDGKPYCEQHYHAVKGSLCATCQKPITGRCVTAMGRKYHFNHFNCAHCGSSGIQTAFKEHKGRPFCKSCHCKLFG